VHGSNAGNLSVQLFLSQLAKMFCLSYYCLCLLFNKIGERAEQFLPGREGWGEREEARDGRRKGLNNVCIYK
jgi:hypothetical protein